MEMSSISCFKHRLMSCHLSRAANIKGKQAKSRLQMSSLGEGHQIRPLTDLTLFQSERYRFASTSQMMDKVEIVVDSHPPREPQPVWPRSKGVMRGLLDIWHFGRMLVAVWILTNTLVVFIRNDLKRAVCKKQLHSCSFDAFKWVFLCN